jgi:hypothetical protein
VKKYFAKIYIKFILLKWKIFGYPNSFDEFFEQEEKTNFFFTKVQALSSLGYTINLNEPKSFNEKLLQRKLFSRDPIWPIVTDKIAVRNWITQHGLDQYAKLIPIHSVFDAVDGFSKDMLGKKLVLKGAWASGYNLFLDQYTEDDHEELIAVMNAWLIIPYKPEKLIWASSKIPKRFIVEKKLKSSLGGIPEDYKLFVFNGKVEFIQVDYDRYSGHKRNMFSREGDLLPFSYVKGKNDSMKFIERSCLNKLVIAAEKIGSHFDFIRVDLYFSEGEVYFGEITQTPHSGHGRFNPSIYDNKLGELWS